MQENNVSRLGFEACQKCSICNEVCPMMEVNPLYPGPKKAGPDQERYRLKDPVFYDYALKYCLNCKRCEVACPSGVHVADLIQRARLDYAPSPKHPLRDTMLASTDFVGSLASPFAPIVNAVLPLKPVKAILDGAFAIDKRRTFPKYSPKTFVSWFRREAAPRQKEFSRFVSFFHGCYANYNYPQLGKDFVTVLNAFGIGVELLDKEKCCGVAMISNGMIREAKKHAVHNVGVLGKAVAAGRKVLATSSTCTFTMRDEYPELLGIDNAAVRDSIQLVTKYLFERIDAGDLKPVFRKDYKARIAYHTPCHLEKLGWGVFSTGLLKMIPGVEFTLLDSNCCGIAGTYGFKKENYAVSQAIGKPLFDQIGRVAPDFVACDCETCKWQIEMSTGLPVRHPVSVLAEALDLAATADANR